MIYNSSSTPLNGASVFVSGPVASPEVKDITVANSPGDAVLTEGASGSEQMEVRISNVTVDACAEGILGYSTAITDNSAAGHTVTNNHV